MTRQLIAVAVAVWSVAPLRAAAFSDTAAFAEPAIEGGGGGHYFTGSRRDGHACSVCHSGAEPPALEIRGLPKSFKPGETHEVTIRWDAAKGSHALHLELTTAAGKHAGLELPALDQLPAQSRCEEREDGEPAVFAIDLDERRVLGVQDCGASEMRFTFTAPDARELFFSLGAVRSDGMSTLTGDGVLELRQRLTRDGAEQSASSCAALPRSGGRGVWVFAGIVALLALPRRRARSLLAAALALGASACMQPRDDAAPRTTQQSYVDEFAELLGENGGGMGRKASDCPPDPSPLERLSLSVRTASGDGRYRPRNVGAFWIEDASGQWVKTLELWGQRRAKWLTRFQAASGGDVVDAVTGPTLSEHEVHELEWDLTAADGCEVENGEYQLRMELTDWSGTGKQYTIPFEKGLTPSELTPADELTFRNIRVALE